MDPNEEARRIETVEDVLRVLVSEKVSFREALDCVEIASAAGERTLLERCGAAALSAAGIRNARRYSLKAAAEAVAEAHIRFAASLESLPETVTDLRDHLRGLVDGDLLPPARAAVLEVDGRLAELQVLLTDPEPASYAGLCSRLRRFGAPHLGVQAANKGLSAAPDDAALLTTKGAAHIDLAVGAYPELDRHHVDEAYRSLNQAWALRQEMYAAAALARLSMATGRYGEALEWARCRADAEESCIAGRTLAAAAILARSESDLSRAMELLDLCEEFESAPMTDGSPWLAVIAAEHLFADGNVDLAERVLRQVTMQGTFERAARLEARIRRYRGGALPATG